MRLPLLLPLVACLLGGAVASQTFPVGVRGFGLVNPTKTGSRILTSTVFYPAKSLGPRAPLLPRKGGYPIVVFLHGFTLSGWMYVELGYALASRGYIGVMADTAPKDLDLQIADGVAVLAALARENSRPGAFLAGALDTKHAAVMGHSTGGSNVVHVLANNPGYRAGIALAPFIGYDQKYVERVAPKVRVPLLILNGANDKITPYKKHAQVVFDQVTNSRDLIVFHLLNKDCNHMTVAAWLSGRPPIAREVFELSQRIVGGFLDTFLRDAPRGLDRVAGRTARAEPRMQAISLRAQRPFYFKVGGDDVPGTNATFQVIAETGFALHFLAGKRANIATSIGTLRLDPATTIFAGFTPIGASKLSLFRIPVSKDPRLRGAVLPLQVIGPSPSGIRFSNATQLSIRK